MRDGPSSRRTSMKSRKLAVKGGARRSSFVTSAAPLTATCLGSDRACRDGWQESADRRQQRLARPALPCES